MLLGWLGRPMGPLMDADSGGGSGGGDGEPKPRVAEVAGRYNSNVISMAEQIVELEREGFKNREKIRNLTTDNEILKKQVAPDGAIVLTGDDASQYQALKALNLKPDEITRKLTEADAAITERDGLKKSMTIRQVAEVAGYKPAVLERLGADLAYTVKDVQETVQGKPTTVKRAYVVKDGKEVPLADHAKSEWADFLPALGATETPAPMYGTPPRDNRRGTPPVDQKQTDDAARQPQATLYRAF